MSDIEHSMQKYFIEGGTRNGQVVELPTAEVGYIFNHPIVGERLTEREYQELSKQERAARFERFEVISENEAKFVGRGE